MDPAPDSAIFVLDLQDASKNYFSAYYFFKVHYVEVWHSLAMLVDSLPAYRNLGPGSILSQLPEVLVTIRRAPAIRRARGPTVRF